MPSYYHIRIKYPIDEDSKFGGVKEHATTFYYEINQADTEVAKISDQYQKGEDIFFDGITLLNRRIEEIKIFSTTYSYISSKNLIKTTYKEGYDFYSQEVTRTFITRPPDTPKDEKPLTITREGVRATTSPLLKTIKDLTEIFLVHGHDELAKLELARMLEKDFGLKPIILHEQADQGRTLIEKFEEHSENVGYVFVLLTPDDVGIDRETFEKNQQNRAPQAFIYRARQNVILELGYFVGKLGRGKVCCLCKGNLELPSDIIGVLYKRFDKSIKEIYKDVEDELVAAGYVNRR